MNKRLVLLLSGPVAVGKSTLASKLVNSHGFRNIRSGKYLQGLALRAATGTSRLALQQLGDDLDCRTDYAWLIDDVAAPQIEMYREQRLWLLDSVRKVRQVEHFRSYFASAVVHVHLTAPEDILRARYGARIAEGGEYEGSTPYEVAIAHPNEVSSRSLSAIADWIVDTTDPHVVEKVLAAANDKQ